MKVCLFQLKNENISIDIQAYFQGKNLVIEGYDIGKTVDEWWGDSDYEYTTTVPGTEVPKLYPLLNVAPGDKEGLLTAIANKCNTNSCYSEFKNFLGKNGIRSEGFSWT